MFHLQTVLKPSPIHGIGLFADESAVKGERVYTSNNNLDLIVTPEQLSRLSEDVQRTIKHYGMLNRKEKCWCLAFDDIRFCNHSKNANLTLQEYALVATRDIQKGEELTHNYAEIEDLREELR